MKGLELPRWLVRSMRTAQTTTTKKQKSSRRAATGISDSAMLPGIRYEDTKAITHSILMRAKHQTIRYIKTVHNLDLKTVRLRSDAQDHAL